MKPKEIVRFDTNTSPWRPEPWLSSLAEVLSSLEVNNYPDTSYRSLRKLLAEYNSVDEDELVVTNGADEALDIVSKVFVEPGSRIVLSTPTYSVFRIVGDVMGGKAIYVPRREGFGDDVNSLVDASSGASLVFLCSPNNPTGNLVETECVHRLLDGTSVPIAVDEAYYEFCGKTFKEMATENSRLMVVRTLSKAFSLAGARVGYIIASKSTVRLLNKVRPPNSLSVISLVLAEIALKDRDKMKELVSEILSAREALVSSLNRLRGMTVFPSEANFLLVRFDGDANRIHRGLLNKGLVTRNLSSVKGLGGCLRFTVLTPQLNAKLVEALRSLI